MTTVDRTTTDVLGPVHEIGHHARAHAFAIGGGVLWLITAAVVGVLSVLDPAARTVLPVYDTATAAWWSGLNLYAEGDGYAYMPHFAVLFTPFRMLGAPWGNVAWMLVSVTWLATALWQLAQCLDLSRPGRVYFFLSLLALPLCGGAIRNGQANVVFAAATLHAVVMLVTARWWWAATLLLAVVAIKPLGIVMLLLAPVVYRRLRPRLALTAAIFVITPFLFGPPAYVLAQYTDFMVDIAQATGVTEHRFANIAGIYRSLGLDLSGAPATVLSLVGAAASLVAWVVGARCVSRVQRGLLLLAVATSYLMLFNPMTESNSYVIVAPALAAWAIVFLETGRRPEGWVLVATVLAIGLLPEPLRSVAPNLSLWAKPLAAMAFIAIVLATVFDPQSVLFRRGLLSTKSVPIAAGSFRVGRPGGRTMHMLD